MTKENNTAPLLAQQGQNETTKAEGKFNRLKHTASERKKQATQFAADNPLKVVLAITCLVSTTIGFIAAYYTFKRMGSLAKAIIVGAVVAAAPPAIEAAGYFADKAMGEKASNKILSIFGK